MLKLVAAVSVGRVASVSRTVMALVLGACWRVGVQVNTLVTGLMLALVGAPGASEYARLSAGVFGSAPVFVTTTRCNTSADMSATGARAGSEKTPRVATRLV